MPVKQLVPGAYDTSSVKIYQVSRPSKEVNPTALRPE